MTLHIRPASADDAPEAGEHDRDSRWDALRTGRGPAGLILVALVAGAGLLAPWLAPHAPDQQFAGATLAGPSGSHPFGTDSVGRDILSRTLYGIRIDLLVIFLAVPIGAALGALLGLAASRSGRIDTAIQRSFDLILAFPTIILAIALTMIAGPGVGTIGLVIVLAEIPVFGRLTRTSVLTVRQLPYVEAARALGAGERWILRRHVLPNCLEPLTVQLALAMSVAVFIEGAMSFLGLGVTPPTPSLGTLIKEGAQSAYHSPFFVVGPLAVVVVLVLGLLLISQALAARSRRQ
ncbi:ABC transporter permease [Nocardia carnea]|uniref:ABC transporter permease n=1 Tax=Nocardia carnea TaxID=37328 RepID=UPI00245654DE|nr:ABC transporter permease [Nocardia carnea]